MSPDRIRSIEDEMDQKGIRDVYDWLIEIGNSPSMAAMLATQSPPGSTNTDSDFSRRENDRMSCMNDHHREEIVKIAKRSGINTQGKTYNGQLVKYDDPLAWVSDKEDVKRAVIKKNLSIRGMVNVDAYLPGRTARCPCYLIGSRRD